MINKELKDLLVILGFEKESNKLPLMKELRRNFLKLSLVKHPDKAGGNKSDFQELSNAYEVLAKAIQETRQEDLNDDEETIARNLFKETNIEKINLFSVTVSILTTQADLWEKVLIDEYGEPNEGKDKANGKKFTVVKNVKDENDESIPIIYVTLWKKEKSGRSTLLIDAKRKQSTSIDYVQSILPTLFRKVLVLCDSNLALTKPEEQVNDTKSKIKPIRKSRKRSLSTGSNGNDVCYREWTCKDCNKKFSSTADLNWHRLKDHEYGVSCDFCSFKAKGTSELEAHQNSQHVRLCDKCEFRSDNVDQLQKHLDSCHTILLSSALHEKCNSCELRFKDKQELNVHILNSHEKTVFRCTLCDFETISNDEIQLHKKIKHKDEVVIDIEHRIGK